MNRAEALSKCLVEGKSVTVRSLPNGKCLSFSGGGFKISNLDGSELMAVDRLPEDATGWEIATVPLADLAQMAHVNKTSGNVFYSLEGSAKFLEREANTNLELLGQVA